MATHQQLTILLVCENTVNMQFRSGVQRVVVETARALASRCTLRLVKWDAIDGQLRDLDADDLRKLFGDDFPPGIAAHPACHRVAFRFVDTIEDPHNSWLLYTEVPHEIIKGAQKLASMRAQCREVGVRSAIIFYDLIPVLEQPYIGSRPTHLEYMIEALLCDCILPISHFSKDSLLEFVEQSAKLEQVQLVNLRRRIIAAPLGEFREGDEWSLAAHVTVGQADTGSPKMIMIGTVEPRKQQVRLLKAINNARERFPELDVLEIDVFGSLHPACAHEFHAERARNCRINYHNYAPDEEIEWAFSKAWFSAFASLHEGYGLPIIESLRHGVPCLTASFGAMAEVASDGGCLLVDTLDDHEMVKGVRRMLSDADLAIELKEGIASRPKRSWGDYAAQIIDELSCLSQRDRAAEAAFVEALGHLVQAGRGTDSTVQLHGVTWTITVDPAHAASAVDRADGKSAALLLLEGVPSKAQIATITQADILAGNKATQRAAVIAAANQAHLGQLLPPNAFFGPQAIEEATTEAIALSRVRGAAHAVRDETTLRRRLFEAYWGELPHPPEMLAIVLSTYNRGAFVEHNVEWLLGQIDRDNLPVRCVVVDNASTDDSVRRLQRFVGHPRFTLVENANNVGMLGNLRVCAAGLFAPYVWLTGDDDFIIPGRIQSVLDAIDNTPGVPLMVHNFAIYHRAAFTLNDQASHFLNEMHRLAPDPAPGGIRPINAIAGEHDNLYTAIYPLVFRCDVLAACFDYPFTGIPFGDLTECVPTSKLLLGSYRYADAMWFDEVGIVGNAHNSWSGHRPRWHLVLMPLVLQLARDAGVDPDSVWCWLKSHKNLFDEAVDICCSKSDTAHLELPHDIAFGEWCFRQEIKLDERLRLAAPTRVERWSAGRGRNL